MSLPVLQDLKDYLRVQTSAEDTLLTALLARAGAIARGFVRPIELTAKTYVIEDRRGSSLDVGNLRIERRRSRLYIRIPDAPVASSPAVTVTDADGIAWAATDFRVEYATGMIRVAELGQWGAFWNFPFTVTATVGLASRADYSTVVEPALSAGFVDIAADLYRRRNPAATGEHAGGGLGVNYGRADESIPVRALDFLAPYRRPQL